MLFNVVESVIFIEVIILKKFFTIFLLAIAVVIGSSTAVQPTKVSAAEAVDIYLEDGLDMKGVHTASLTGWREKCSVECYFGGPEGKSRKCRYNFREDSNGVMWFKHNAGGDMEFQVAANDQDATAIIRALELYGYR